MTDAEDDATERVARGFTPEPWQVVEADDGSIFVATAGDVVCLPDPNHEPDDAWDRVNARAIAALPDLIEAMQGIEHFADAVAYRDDTLSSSLREWINAGRAALDKAGARP